MAACALPAWSDATGLRWRSKYRKAEEGKAVTRVVGAADRLQATAHAAGTISRCSHTDQKAISETAVRRPPNQLRPDRREREVP